MSPLLASSWSISASIWRSTDRAEPSRPSSARFLDLGVPAGLVERDGVARLELALAAAVLGGAERHELLAEQARLAQLRHGLVGEVGVGAQLHRDDGLVAIEVDVGHLADADVVDLHRRLRHQVEYVGELRRHRDRVGTGVGAAGEGQLVDVEVAARGQQGQDEDQQQGAQPLHRSTSTSPPSDGS
jgi:hypothetical protein